MLLRSLRNLPCCCLPLLCQQRSFASKANSANTANTSHTSSTSDASNSKEEETLEIKIMRPYKGHKFDVPSDVVKTSASELLHFFYTMSYYRRFEIVADTAYKARQIRGFCHLYVVHTTQHDSLHHHPHPATGTSLTPACVCVSLALCSGTTGRRPCWSAWRLPSTRRTA